MRGKGGEEVSDVFHVLWPYVASARPSKYPTVVVLYIALSNQVHTLAYDRGAFFWNVSHDTD